MTQILNKPLDTLRLPELQALFAEITGQTTKSPNKTYLIRRINEVLAAQAEDALAEEQAIEREPDEVVETADETITEIQDAAPADEAPTEAMDEPAHADDDAAGETTADTEAESPEASEEPADADQTPLSKLGVAALQQRYLDVVGRPTGSSDKRYLIWKIREAQKGRVPVGPRTRRSPSEPAAEHMVLPVRMETSLVQRLDAAREHLGIKSRMDLFRRALSHYLRDAGETELATAILPEA